MQCLSPGSEIAFLEVLLDDTQGDVERAWPPAPMPALMCGRACRTDLSEASEYSRPGLALDAIGTFLS